MSLSAINETNYTPKEISDEILAKTVVFCKETGYRQNAVMITFFWSAFLYCAKNYLDDELTEKVMCSFPSDSITTQASCTVYE